MKEQIGRDLSLTDLRRIIERTDRGWIPCVGTRIRILRYLDADLVLSVPRETAPIG